MVPLQAARQLIGNGMGQHILATGSAGSAPEATSREKGCLGFGAAGSATNPKGWSKGAKGGFAKGKGAKVWGKGGKGWGLAGGEGWGGEGWGGEGWGLAGGEGLGDGHGKGDARNPNPGGKKERKGPLQLRWQVDVFI